MPPRRRTVKRASDAACRLGDADVDALAQRLGTPRPCAAFVDVVQHDMRRDQMIELR